MDDLKERLTRKADEIWLMAAEEAGKAGKPVYPRDVLRAWIVPNLLAEIDRLKAAKWEEQHTDTMNDMAALAIDRDSWKEQADRLKAENERLREQVANRDAAAKAVILGEHLSIPKGQEP